MEKKDIASYTLDELTEEMKSIGEKPFRAKQIYEWIHVKTAEAFWRNDQSVQSAQRKAGPGL